MRCVLGPLHGKSVELPRHEHYYQCAVMPPISLETYKEYIYNNTRLDPEPVQVVTYRLRQWKLFGEDISFLAPADLSDEAVKRTMIEKWFR